MNTFEERIVILSLLFGAISSALVYVYATMTVWAVVKYLTGNGFAGFCAAGLFMLGTMYGIKLLINRRK